MPIEKKIGERLARGLLRALRPLWRLRRVALWTEILFWQRWLAQRYPDRTRAGAVDPPVPQRLWRFIEPVGDDPVKILEVGAGPIPTVGAWHPTRRVEITATDVLAEQYQRMLERRGVDPRVRTVFADAERLTERFGANAFHLVYAANCVDHMSDPMRAIEQMVSVVKPGGHVVMEHMTDEGARQGYAGLHQWNLNAPGGRLTLWNERSRHDVAALLSASCDVQAECAGGLVLAEIRKR